MAGPYYVRSTDGSDASDGLTWANAKATLVGALAVAAAGERIWVSQVHSESTAAAVTLTPAGTAASPIEILCGNDAAEPPTALATTGIIATGAGNFALNISGGFAYFYGLTFQAGVGSASSILSVIAGGAAPTGLIFDTCAYQILATGANAEVSFGTQSGNVDDVYVQFINSTFKFSATGQALPFLNGRYEFRGVGIDSGGTAPTTLLKNFTIGPGATVRWIGSDLSLVVGNLINAAGGHQADVKFEQCKLGSGVTLVTGTIAGPGGMIASIDNCDSADTNYRMQRAAYQGNVFSETTVVRTSGASDGVTPLAHKMVSSAGPEFFSPLCTPGIPKRNTTTGSPITVTVEIIHDSVTNLQDDEVWVEVEYLGTSGFPISSFISDRMTDILATPADQTTSAATWTTTGLTNPNTQKLAVTFTPQEAGLIRANVMLAKPSYTVYVDPKVAIS